MLAFAELRYGNSGFNDSVKRALVRILIALLNKSWHTVISSIQVLKNLLPIVHYLQNVFVTYSYIATNVWEKILKKWPVSKLITNYSSP